MSGPANIYLVDDDPTVAALHARAIQRRGYDVLFFESAKDAIAAVRSGAPQLLISDVQMPEMGGFSLCETLVAEELKSFPVMFLTAHDDLDVLRAGLKAGGDEFLIKGTPIETLLERMVFWLASGFRALPAAPRKKAIILANEEAGDEAAKIADRVVLDPAILDRIVAAFAADVEAAGQDYGERLVERIYFLGRLATHVMDACNDIGSAIRFPDYLVSAANRVGVDWARDLPVLLARYDTLATDPRFLAAASEGLLKVG
ncbi:MAG: response regulator [Sphingomonadales bacterium]|nr:response regulator [Sphingomonadales bacterium]